MPSMLPEHVFLNEADFRIITPPELVKELSNSRQNYFQKYTPFAFYLYSYTCRACNEANFRIITSPELVKELFQFSAKLFSKIHTLCILLQIMQHIRFSNIFLIINEILEKKVWIEQIKKRTAKTLENMSILMHQVISEIATLLQERVKR